jgi:hypothetical protein
VSPKRFPHFIASSVASIKANDLLCAVQVTIQRSAWFSVVTALHNFLLLGEVSISL